VVLGIAVTTGYAAYQGWPALVPAWAMAGGLAGTLLIGGLAGPYPAIRAAGSPPPRPWPRPDPVISKLTGPKSMIDR
jgi:hypothetical protein